MNRKPRTWLTANIIYEDFPIYFRRPDIKVSEIEELKLKYPLLLTIKHELSKVKNNGLPEADYNDSLELFDSALTEPFKDEVFGIVALIETYLVKELIMFT